MEEEKELNELINKLEKEKTNEKEEIVENTTEKTKEYEVRDLKEENQSLRDKNKYLIIMVIVIIILMALMIGGLNNSNSSKEDEYKNQISGYKTEIEELNKKELEYKAEIDSLKQVDEQNYINGQIEKLKSEVQQLEKEKKQLKREKSTLEEDVVKLKGKAKTYPAGHLIVGEDIPEGKYKIYGGSSNFAVYDAYGDLEVNIILGSGSYEVSEYIYTFEEGDKVEANSSFKLISVE